MVLSQLEANETNEQILSGSSWLYGPTWQTGNVRVSYILEYLQGPSRKFLASNYKDIL